jgi:hypothetical protein
MAEQRARGAVCVEDLVLERVDDEDRVVGILEQSLGALVPLRHGHGR